MGFQLRAPGFKEHRGSCTRLSPLPKLSGALSTARSPGGRHHPGLPPRARNAQPHQARFRAGRNISHPHHQSAPFTQKHPCPLPVKPFKKIRLFSNLKTKSPGRQRRGRTERVPALRSGLGIDWRCWSSRRADVSSCSRHNWVFLFSERTASLMQSSRRDVRSTSKLMCPDTLLGGSERRKLV